MDELVQFLRDRLDEDERAARRAGDSFRQIGETGVIVAAEGDRAEECASANWAGVAEHIVRHDPARILAEVEAKRQIIERCTAVQRLLLDDFTAEHLADDVLALLALPYADHPAFKPEWRP